MTTKDERNEGSINLQLTDELIRARIVDQSDEVTYDDFLRHLGLTHQEVEAFGPP